MADARRSHCRRRRWRARLAPGARRAQSWRRRSDMRPGSRGVHRCGPGARIRSGELALPGASRFTESRGAVKATDFGLAGRSLARTRPRAKRNWRSRPCGRAGRPFMGRSVSWGASAAGDQIDDQQDRQWNAEQPEEREACLCFGRCHVEARCRPRACDAHGASRARATAACTTPVDAVSGRAFDRRQPGMRAPLPKPRGPARTSRSTHRGAVVPHPLPFRGHRRCPHLASMMHCHCT